jgi:hypothetical protein
MHEESVSAPDTEPSSPAPNERAGGGLMSLRDHPVLVAGLLSVVAAAVGYRVAAGQTGDLQGILQVAATTLLFGTLIGGVVKLLLEDVQRTRAQRSEQARFVTAVLSDLKATYDRVERVRILIPAHQSALTYGKEMRDLIDARVQLRNVIRALDNGSGIHSDRLPGLKWAVERMERYLASLTDEFQTRYKPIADAQRDYEAQVKQALACEHPQAQHVHNEAWAELEALPRLSEFLARDGLPAGREVLATDDDALRYSADFEDPLDLASWVLRAELKRLLGTGSPALPERHAATWDRLRPRSEDGAINGAGPDHRPVAERAPS